MPYRVMVTGRLISSHCGGTTWPSHWMSQPPDSAPTRRLRISQPANSTYSAWRLIAAVISTNSASTIMPPSSRPDLRWYCSIDRANCWLCHWRTVSRAGPEKVARHSTCGGSCASLRAKPALTIDSDGDDWLREAAPSDCSVAGSQHAMLMAWRDGNSITSALAGRLTVSKLNHSGASDSLVSYASTAWICRTRASAAGGASGAPSSATTFSASGTSSLTLYWFCQNSSAIREMMPIPIGMR